MIKARRVKLNNMEESLSPWDFETEPAEKPIISKQ